MEMTSGDPFPSLNKKQGDLCLSVFIVCQNFWVLKT